MSYSLREAFNKIRALFRSNALDQEAKEEMASHLEMAIEENLRRGMSAAKPPSGPCPIWRSATGNRAAP